MLISTEIYNCELKNIKEVIRKTDGKEFKLPTLYLKDAAGIVTELVVNDFVYSKAEINKNYKVKALLSANGKISINDIELCK